MFDLRGFVLGWIIVAFSLGGYFGYGYWQRTHEPMAMVERCAKEQSLSCVRPHIREMLGTSTPARVMTMLSRNLQPMTCHYFGHVVGQEAFLQSANVETALSRCNRVCDSACVHGVVGAAFATELGIEDLDAFDVDVQHLSEGELREVGSKLCTNIGTCHGVGHTLFQLYQAFEPAFALCREITTPLTVSMCYNGATMEFADTLDARNTGAALGVDFPKESELATFCDFPTLKETRACFRYFPRIVARTLAQQGVSEPDAMARVRDICDAQLSAGRRVVCYGGIGSYGSYLILTDVPAAVSSCEQLSDRQATASCIIGRVSVATEDRMVPLAAYCSALAAAYQPTCFRGLFNFLERVGVSDTDQQMLCEERGSVCTDAFEARFVNPVPEIEAYEP